MEKKLKSLLDDLAYYALVESNQNKDVSQVAPFDKFADRDNLLIFLQTACYKCVDRLLEYINQQLAEAEKLLTESQDDGDANKKQILLNRALLLGRLCAALCDLTPNLQQCMLGLQAKEVKAEQSRGYSRRFGSLRSHGKSKGNPEPTEWDKIKELLNANCHKAYSVWMTCKRVELVGNFQSSLTDITGNTALQMATNWEQISIEEETEDGNKVTSTIRLPVQASWYVQSVLYSLCEEFNRVGGHALPKSVIQEMITSISDDMLSAYERILDNTSKDDKPLPLTQSRALQLYFDVKYMSSLMSGRKDTEQESTEHARRIQKLTETLENNIDPFDLDVFIPHLNTNLNRHSIRTSVLLGALSTPERPIYSHRPIPTGHQEQHNVLPLTPAQGRFSLLPLSTTHSGYGDGQSLLSKQLQLTTPSLESITRSSTKTDETIDSNTASSLYSKLGSFGSFRSNWLS
uniref:Conserved oligomeric Golgi complex subunit 1 n=1 Tax=Saccoglossus kowalevskii TaxID=10224 RepID=A0ABM0LUV5_SACKO|nr:PREDICTED: conserved oligomeric Golgi complex subunit 1-like [Saccoglossus kowalevskii]